MMIALKMIAESTAEAGECRPMMFSTARPGNTPMNIAGMMAKYLAMSFAMEKVVSASQMLGRNLLVYGLGGIIAPFIGIWLIDLLVRLIPGF